MLLTHQESKGVIARLKAGAIRAGANDREAAFTLPPGRVPVGDVMVLAGRYSLDVRSLFSTVALASPATVAGSSPSALVRPKN